MKFRGMGQDGQIGGEDNVDVGNKDKGANEMESCQGLTLKFDDYFTGHFTYKKFNKKHTQPAFP